MEKELERAVILLKAARELLSKQYKSHYVLNMLETTVFYDDAECDGSCLIDDIGYLLDEIESE